MTTHQQLPAGHTLGACLRAERLTWDEYRVRMAILSLNDAGRTTNNSQIAAMTGLSRSKISEVTGALRRAGYIKDIGKGAAYHWRLTGKVPQT